MCVPIPGTWFINEGNSDFTKYNVCECAECWGAQPPKTWALTFPNGHENANQMKASPWAGQQYTTPYTAEHLHNAASWRCMHWHTHQWRVPGTTVFCTVVVVVLRESPPWLRRTVYLLKTAVQQARDFRPNCFPGCPRFLDKKRKKEEVVPKSGTLTEGKKLGT